MYCVGWWMLSGHLFQNVMLLMMGSAEELPQAPLERPKFIEDMSDAEAAAAVSGVCVGGKSRRRRCGRISNLHTRTHTIIITYSCLCRLGWRTLATRAT